MSEHETQQVQPESVAADAAELSEGEMEGVAGGTSIIDQAIETAKRLVDLLDGPIA